MKLQFLIILLLIFSQHTDGKPNRYTETESIKDACNQPVDSVYIKFDTNAEFNLDILSTKVRQIFVKPHTNYKAYYFDNYSSLFYFPIPTEVIYPISPGDSLIISSKNNFPYIKVINNKKYSEREVNFVSELSRKNISIFEYIYKSKRKGTPEEAYKASLNYADSLSNKGELGETLVHWFKKEAEFSYLRLPEYTSIKIEPIDITKKLNIDSNLHIYFYRRLLWMRMDNLLNKDYSIDRVIQVAEKNFTGASRDYVLFEFAVQNLSTKNAKQGKLVISELDGHFIDNNYISVLTSQYLAKYDTDLGMVDPMLQADGTTTSFEKMISKYKGKRIYIDLWASWCGPCREQIPYSHSLKKSLESENVAFVYLSIDKVQNDWLKANIEEGLGNADSYLFVNPREADFLKKYEVNEIPRYFVIDENGNVINEDAPRPSSADIITLFKE